MQNPLYSNGNLIISGEYFVLAGATALAVPLKSGQSLLVENAPDNPGRIRWITNEMGKPWFSAEFSAASLTILNSTDDTKASFLQKILISARNKQPEFITAKGSYLITCETDFDLNWGWGSSSALITNIANWAGINPFELNSIVSSGSGYDIAASQAGMPIFYSIKNNIPEISPAPFNPPFRDFILFLYLGRKQNTVASIVKNLGSVKKQTNLIPLINSISEQIANEKDINEFMKYISEHEKILSSSLNMPRLKQEYFYDFPGEIKSLGAWGGDCAMVVSDNDESAVRKYFAEKGLKILFGFNEIVKI